MDQEATKHQEQFKGKEISFTVERKPHCLVLFHVHASPQFAKETYQKAIRSVSKQVSFPGFRKGKVPQELVIKNHGNAINEEWKQAMADTAFPEAEQIAKIPVLKKDAKITFDVKTFALDKGAELTFQFETEPTIPSIDPKRFKLSPVKRPAVTDKEIDETIRQIQFYFAEWSPITDRPAQQGDFVILDVDVVDPPSNLFHNTRFEISNHSMAKWMQPLIIGRNAGETIEGISTPDEDLPEEEKSAFSPQKVSIALKKIEAAILPPFDEKYYRSLGVANADELRAFVTRLLNEKADEHVKEAERSQAVHFLLNQNPFDLPPSFVNNEARFRMRQLSLDENFKQEWNSLTKEKQQEIIQQITEQSDRAVRLFYICNRILKEANLSISADDLPKPPTTALEVLIKPSAENYVHEDSALKEAESYSRLILEKAEDYIISMADRS